jgi:hypothetical protein
VPNFFLAGANFQKGERHPPPHDICMGTEPFTDDSGPLIGYLIMTPSDTPLILVAERTTVYPEYSKFPAISEDFLNFISSQRSA